MNQFPRISSEEMLNMAFSIMNNRQKQKFKETTELDMSYGVAGLGRFRVNVFQQRGNVGMVLRVIPTKIRNLDELFLPKILDKICDELRGMVLVTGTTGSGKSTTLAAMVDRINSTRTDHIITIEDPIEFLHRDKKGFVNQREVEVDTPNFGSALRAALRQDPDVILVGEMRDMETMSTALHAAETGHMVFSTLHTTDATETVTRIIAVYPPPEQKQIRLQLAAVLKAVISQRLVRKSDGIGRVPAVEVLLATEYIRDCIINPEKTRMIRDAIAAGISQYGMQTFDQSIYDLYSQGLISIEEGLANASNPDEFKLRLAGIRTTTDAAREEMERASQVDRFAKK
jgi:twitching motility protein PilT